MSHTIKKRWKPQMPYARAGLLHYRVLIDAGIDWQNGNIPKGELLTVKASSRYILVGRWIAAGVITREPNPLEGMCQVCKCTWSRACAGGCSWTSEARTRCTKCERKNA